MGIRAALVVLMLLVPATAQAKVFDDPNENPIVAENLQQGTTRWDVAPPDHPAIEGYASETSVAPGQRFHLHVNPGSPNDRYRIYVYRIGWYGGDGGRLVTCIPGCDSDETVQMQPPPPRPHPATGRVSAGWSVSDTIAARKDWVSGYYLAQLRVTLGPDEGAVGRVPLVVRGRPGDASAILVQVPVNTWQAYNPWGGKSLYTYNSTRQIAASKVSFDRPYSEAVLVDFPWSLEIQVVRFPEREHADVTYATDVDVDRSPGILMNHRLAMSVGHDEYWSTGQRDAFDRALNHSTNIAALGANTAYWQIDYENAHRTVARIAQFRALEPGRPECRLFGVMYAYNAQRWAGGQPTPYELAAPAGDPWLLQTGLDRKDDIPDIVGYEWDTLEPGCFPGRVTRLLHAEPAGVDQRIHPADAVRGLARSGARTFASGSIEFSWALDGYGNHLPSKRIQVLMENALRDLTRPASPRPVNVTVGHAGVSVRAHRRNDPRVRRIAIYVHRGAGRFRLDDDGVEIACRPINGICRDKLRAGTVRYAAVAVDRWGESEPWFSSAVRESR